MNRITKHEVLRFEPHIARYTMLQHEKALPNPSRFNQINSFRSDAMLTNITQENNKNSSVNERFRLDGLSNTQYKLMSITKKPLYTHIIVDF
jgi:hypothetical protein